MIAKRIDLYKEFNLTRPEGGAGYLDTFVLDPIYQGRIRPAMLVIAGGGYSAVSLREKEPIALSYAVQGLTTFTLTYSCKPLHFPTQLLEASMAMIYIREHAEEFMIDPQKICAVGFSAGGHLTGMLATLFDCKEVKETFGERAKLIKPNEVIFSYAVVSNEYFAHQGSITNISGGCKRLANRLSIEKHIKKNSPPAFIWGTLNDGVVPSENSFALARAYKEKGIPFEFHIFENGSHGLSVATKETRFVNEPVQAWIGLSVTWLKQRGYVIKDVE
ncbi:MAG: alpha/beta hydrolase [Clostridia bacterium]|nr:alpha/beta hydrolase [Clostridia bacterium]